MILDDGGDLTALMHKEYKDLLAQNLVQPTNMELYVCNVDGSDLKKITSQVKFIHL